MLFWNQMQVDDDALSFVDEMRAIVETELACKIIEFAKRDWLSWSFPGRPTIVWYDMHDVVDREKAGWDETREPPKVRWRVRAEWEGICG